MAKYREKAKTHI